MQTDDNYGKVRPRKPSFRGQAYAYVSNGEVRVAAWPAKRKRGHRSHLTEEQEWFRQAQWASKYWPAQMQAQCAEAVKGTPLMPRDIMTMIMAGRAFFWVSEQGWKVYSVAARNDVSESLDVLSQVPGSMLYRSPDYWTFIPPGTAGNVLTSTGPDTAPTWQPSGASGGQRLLPYTDCDLLNNSAVAGTPAIVVVPCYADSAAEISGLLFPVRGIRSGLTVRPVIYGGADPLLGAPPATGAPLQAEGQPVAIGVANTLYKCPLDAPFVPVVGRWYYIGFIYYGSSGTITLAAGGANKRQFYSETSHAVAPSVLPAMNAASNNNNTYWSY